MNQSEPTQLTPIDTGKRLEGVKDLMRSNDVSIYLVPTEDAHGSEYISPADARREYITGFTGSAGTALILLDHPQSLLFTDGRYFNQASKQLHPTYWKLMKQGIDGVPTWQDYLIKAAADRIEESKRTQRTNLETNTTTADERKDGDDRPVSENDLGLKIGIDPTLISSKDSDDLSKKLRPYSARLVSLKDNLIDLQWDSSRPTKPHDPIKILELKYSGQSTIDKIQRIRDRLVELNDSNQEVIGIVVSALDEIAWCLNLRGSDILYNPVFFSYLWIDTRSNQPVILFVNPEQVSSELKKYLDDNRIHTRPYSSIWEFLSHDLKSNLKINSKVLISPTTSLAVEDHLGGESRTIKLRSPLQDLKSIKNPIEIQGFRDSHLRDGVALVTYFAWLEDHLSDPNSKPLNEFDAATRLEKFRKDLGGQFFQGLSFTTISSTGKNAAIIHYSPDPIGSAIIDKDQVYLCDSGAQYLDGTTDVTRTWHFGTPTEEEKRAFTRVLQGHISLAQAVFPDKTTGYLLDPLARQYLWLDGLDYRHGTGHGVGHFLNVHEGPQGIGTRPQYSQVRLKAGMTLSNEPGYYKDEGFGIRIESIVIIKQIEFHDGRSSGLSDDPSPPPTNYYGFETVTMCPIQTKLLNKSLLNSHQIEWLNAYHLEVFQKLSPFLKNDSKTLQWLTKECRPIT